VLGGQGSKLPGAVRPGLPMLLDFKKPIFKSFVRQVGSREIGSRLVVLLSIAEYAHAAQAA